MQHTAIPIARTEIYIEDINFLANGKSSHQVCSIHALITREGKLINLITCTALIGLIRQVLGAEQ